MKVLLLVVCCISFSTFAQSKHIEPFLSNYSQCHDLNVTLVGYNFVLFQGDVKEYSAREILSSKLNMSIVLGLKKTVFEKNTTVQGEQIVELRKSSGFAVSHWYLVCGKTASCEECVVVRYCSCDCDTSLPFIVSSVAYESESLVSFTEDCPTCVLEQKTRMIVCLDYSDGACNRVAVVVTTLHHYPASSGVATSGVYLESLRNNSYFYADVTWSLLTRKIREDNPSEGINVPDAQVIKQSTWKFQNLPFPNHKTYTVLLSIPYQNPANSMGEIQRICREIANQPSVSTTTISTSTARILGSAKSGSAVLIFLSFALFYYRIYY